MNKHKSYTSTLFPPHYTTNPQLMLHHLISRGVNIQIMLGGGGGAMAKYGMGVSNCNLRSSQVGNCNLRSSQVNNCNLRSSQISNSGKNDLYQYLIYIHQLFLHPNTSFYLTLSNSIDRIILKQNKYYGGRHVPILPPSNLSQC
jgi:hypothetical protein